MIFFEYLFCRLHWISTEIVKEKDTPRAASIFGLSAYQGFTIVPLYDITYVFLFKSHYIEDVLGINPYLIIGVIVLVINIFYFNYKSKYAVLLEKFKNMPIRKRKKRDILCII